MHHVETEPGTAERVAPPPRAPSQVREGNQCGRSCMVCDVCFDCSSTTDERLARAEFREEVAGLPSSAHFGAPFCFFGFGGGALVFPGLSGKTLVALTCESGGDR